MWTRTGRDPVCGAGALVGFWDGAGCGFERNLSRIQTCSDEEELVEVRSGRRRFWSGFGDSADVTYKRSLWQKTRVGTWWRCVLLLRRSGRSDGSVFRVPCG